MLKKGDIVAVNINDKLYVGTLSDITSDNIMMDDVLELKKEFIPVDMVPNEQQKIALKQKGATIVPVNMQDLVLSDGSVIFNMSKVNFYYKVGSELEKQYLSFRAQRRGLLVEQELPFKGGHA